MPQIELSPPTFERLQKFAIPLVDTPEKLINRILDVYENSSASIEDVSDRDIVPTQTIRDFDGTSPPNLTHTKVLVAEFCKIRLSKADANWNGLLNEAIRFAKKKAASDEEFKRLILVNFIMRKKEDEGYRYLDDVGVSVQGQDANAAWKAACYIAQQLGCSFEIVFTWRNKEEAAYPGVTGRFVRRLKRFI